MTASAALRRPVIAAIAALGALSLPGAALAARGSTTFTGRSFLPALRTPGTVSGTVTAINGGSFTIQTAGKLTGTINALVQAANSVTAGDYPYVWGGGHAQAGIASAGIKGGPGANGKRVGYDCSGSVAAVLAGAGLWPAGGGVPSDAGVIAELRQQGLIAKGPGQAPDNVTLYDDPGVHIFMNIGGRFFGTSDGGGGGNPKGGAGWLYDGAYDATSKAFKQYHFLPAVLHDKTSFGHILTFTTGYGSTLLTGIVPGTKVTVSYGQSSAGTMVATAIAWVGSVTVTQTLTGVSADGSSFTAEGADGQPVSYLTAGASGLLSGLAAGDSVQISYTKGTGGTRTARAVKLVSAPAATQVSGNVTAIATDYSSVTVQTAGGQSLTIDSGLLSSTVQGLSVGGAIDVAYVTLPDGSLVAQAITNGTAANPSGGGSYGPDGGS